MIGHQRIGVTDVANAPVQVVEEYRNYSDNMQTSIVYNHYKQMRTNQCAAFTERMMKKVRHMVSPSLVSADAQSSLS